MANLLPLIKKETIERALVHLKTDSGKPSERLALALIELLKGYLEMVKTQRDQNVK